jgi:hypothetical protein
VKVGSLRLKNIFPNPLAIPELQAAKVSFEFRFGGGADI